MKELIKRLKHTPSTLVGLLLILAATFLLAVGKIEFESYQGYVIEGALWLAGLRALTYKPKEQE